MIDDVVCLLSPLALEFVLKRLDASEQLQVLLVLWVRLRFVGIPPSFSLGDVCKACRFLGIDFL